jgi:hypothetical protein
VLLSERLVLPPPWFSVSSVLAMSALDEKKTSLEGSVPSLPKEDHSLDDVKKHYVTEVVSFFVVNGLVDNADVNWIGRSRC